MTQEEDKLWRLAQKRVAFKRHLFVYIVCNLSLIIIWYFSEGRYNEDKSYWFIYPLAGWGIGLVFHYWSAYHDDESSVKKEYQRLKKENGAEGTDSQNQNPPASGQ